MSIEEKLDEILNKYLPEHPTDPTIKGNHISMISEVRGVLKHQILELIKEARIDELEKVYRFKTWEIIEVYEKGEGVKNMMMLEEVVEKFITPVKERLNQLSQQTPNN